MADYYHWLQQQAQLWQEGKVLQLDAESVGDLIFRAMEESYRDRLFASVSTVLKQFLMVNYFPDLHEWVTISEVLHPARADALELLDESPSLRALLEAEYPRIWAYSLSDVKTTFTHFQQDVSVLPETNPYGLDVLLDEKALPENWAV